MRNVLLSRLKEDEKFGQKRINELSDFLLDYVRQQLWSDDPDIQDFAQAQRWMALAHTRPSEAARELAFAFSQLDEKDRPEVMRMASLVETIAEPLSELEEFKSLLIYARGMASFAYGNQEEAKAQFRKLQGKGTHRAKDKGFPQTLQLEVPNLLSTQPLGSDNRIKQPLKSRILSMLINFHQLKSSKQLLELMVYFFLHKKVITRFTLWKFSFKQTRKFTLDCLQKSFYTYGKINHKMTGVLLCYIPLGV